MATNPNGDSPDVQPDQPDASDRVSFPSPQDQDAYLALRAWIAANPKKTEIAAIMRNAMLAIMRGINDSEKHEEVERVLSSMCVSKDERIAEMCADKKALLAAKDETIAAEQSKNARIDQQTSQGLINVHEQTIKTLEASLVQARDERSSALKGAQATAEKQQQNLDEVVKEMARQTTDQQTYDRHQIEELKRELAEERKLRAEERKVHAEERAQANVRHEHRVDELLRRIDGLQAALNNLTINNASHYDRFLAGQTSAVAHTLPPSAQPSQRPITGGLSSHPSQPRAGGPSNLQQYVPTQYLFHSLKNAAGPPSRPGVNKRKRAHEDALASRELTHPIMPPSQDGRRAGSVAAQPQGVGAVPGTHIDLTGATPQDSEQQPDAQSQSDKRCRSS